MLFIQHYINWVPYTESFLFYVLKTSLSKIFIHFFNNPHHNPFPIQSHYQKLSRECEYWSLLHTQQYHHFHWEWAKEKLLWDYRIFSSCITHQPVSQSVPLSSSSHAFLATMYISMISECKEQRRGRKRENVFCHKR